MCKYCKKNTCIICCKKVAIKRWFLPGIGAIALLLYEEARDYVYLPFLISFVFFIFFWNFPFIVYHTASRPLYYEDLFIDEKKLPNYDVDETIKKKFQCILVWVLIITNTILAGALSEYWFYQLQGNFTHSWIEMIGVTGGIIKIFQICNNTLVRIMLKILRHYVKQENIQYTEDQIEKIQKIIRLKKRCEKNIISMRRDDMIELKEESQNMQIRIS
jgi:hypothetical protein|tara:strand:- start:420 stop:1070 length:651 start_codon:yes stop_codon:yes gene_type:complete